MSSYLELQQRVEGYINRTDFRAEVKQEIQSAIREYEGERWRFNQTSTAMATSAGQSFLSLPSNFLILDSIEIDLGSRIPLDNRDLDYILQMRASSATGSPTDFTIYNDQIELAVVPDSAYSVTCRYIKTLAVLSADSDTNEWTTGVMQDVIVHCATYSIFDTIIRDEKQAFKHEKKLAKALTAAGYREIQFHQRRLRSSGF